MGHGDSSLESQVELTVSKFSKKPKKYLKNGRRQKQTHVQRWQERW